MYQIGFNKDPTANGWAGRRKYNFQADIETLGEELRGRRFTSGHGDGRKDTEADGRARVKQRGRP